LLKRILDVALRMWHWSVGISELAVSAGELPFGPSLELSFPEAIDAGAAAEARDCVRAGRIPECSLPALDEVRKGRATWLAVASVFAMIAIAGTVEASLGGIRADETAPAVGMYATSVATLALVFALRRRWWRVDRDIRERRLRVEAGVLTRKWKRLAGDDYRTWGEFWVHIGRRVYSVRSRGLFDALCPGLRYRVYASMRAGLFAAIESADGEAFAQPEPVAEPVPDPIVDQSGRGHDEEIPIASALELSLAEHVIGAKQAESARELVRLRRLPSCSVDVLEDMARAPFIMFFVVSPMCIVTAITLFTGNVSQGDRPIVAGTCTISSVVMAVLALLWWRVRRDIGARRLRIDEGEVTRKWRRSSARQLMARIGGRTYSVRSPAIFEALAVGVRYRVYSTPSVGLFVAIESAEREVFAGYRSAPLAQKPPAKDVSQTSKRTRGSP
jgi:hypothetical protein